MIKCPECGADNTADSNFCRRCGSHFPVVRDHEQTTERYTRQRIRRTRALAGYLPAAGTVLQIRSPGDREGDFLTLLGEVVTIGRSPKSDFFLDDVTVSRRHARILTSLRRLHHRGRGQSQRHLRQSQAHRALIGSSTVTRFR